MKKAVIVTGASGGIGSGVCEAFFESGFTVIGLDRVASAWTGNKAINILEPGFEKITRQENDVRDVSCIVHAAAEQILGGMGEISAQVWNSVMAANVFTLDSLVNEFRPELEKNTGSVVAIGSIHSIVSRKYVGGYRVTKAALEGWVRAASLDYAPVRVNSVVPGAIESGKFHEMIRSKGRKGAITRKHIIERTPLGRLGTAKDVADAALFLSSDAATFITGQSLVVDGGATLVLATEVD